MNDALIILFKNPLLGKVKTRIAKDLGDEKALEVYQKLIDHTQRVTIDLPVAKYLFYGFFIDDQDDWDSQHYHKKLQVQGGLGERMSRAFQEILKKHDRAIIIGSDCIELSTLVLLNAFEELKENDFVIGPTHDGGYYLLGMNAFYPDIFQDMVWSTDQVYRQTINKINKTHRTYSSLPKLYDVDYVDDCKRFNLL